MEKKQQPSEETKPADEPMVPTPEEQLAEEDASDPDVGVDGTGVGELP